MSNLQQPEFWEVLLSKLLEPDTNVINNATQELNTLLQNPGSVISIFERLSNSQNVGVRHQAALLVRNRLQGHWDALEPNIRESMRDTSANIIMNPGTPRPIRNSSTDVIFLIAKLSVPTGQWPTFFPWVISLVQNAERPDLREAGIYLLQNIMECGIESMTTECIESNYNSVRDVLAAGFEVLDYVAETHLSQISNLLPDILIFVLNVGGDVDIPISIRQKALMFLEFVINIKPKTFASSNLLEATIQISFTLMTEEEEDISGEDTGSKYGSQLLDSIALVMPAHMVWPLIMNRLSTFLKHANPEYRKAAINALAILAEGCMEQVEEIFDEVMPLVMNGFGQESQVRQASCIAIAEFSKHLPDLMPPYGDKLVPILVAGIQDAQDLVRIKSCYAISECSTILKEYFMPHIEPLLNRLVEMLTDTNVEVQELAVGALSAVVDMADEHIEPYFGAIIDVMKKWMTISEPEQIPVRGRATECVATLATVRKDLFAPHFQECIHIVLSGLQIDRPDLREFIYQYCEQMVRLEFTEQFAPFVDGLVPYVFATLESFEEFASLGAEDSFTVMDDPEANIDLKKLGAMVDEKDAALSLVGWMAFTFCKQFEKYVSKTHEYLLSMASLVFSPSTCANATLALVQLCSCVQTLVDPEYSWTSGKITPLNAEVEQILGISLEVMIQNIDSEEELVVQNAYEAISNLAQAFGPAAIPEDAMAAICQEIVKVMQKQSTCQLVRESFDEDESDIVLFSVVMETISKFTQVFSELFIGPMESFLMCTRAYLEPNVSSDYKNVIIATLAELAQHLKGAFKPYCASFLPVAMDLLAGKTSKTIKHNSCYCAGLLIQYGEETVHQFYEPLTRILGDVMALDSTKYATAVDNALGAIARMINANPNLMPLDQVVPAMLRLLPLRSDMEPAIPIHQAFFNLLEAKHPSVVNDQAQWTRTIVVELATTELPKEELRDQLIAYSKQMYKQNNNSQEIDSLLQHLVSQGQVSAETAERFRAVLNE